MDTVLIHRLGSLGDTVVALPCFHKIAQEFPDARRLVVTNFPVSQKAAPLLDMLDGSGLVHGAISYRVGLRDPKSLWTLFKEIRATGATTLVYLASSRKLTTRLRDYLFYRVCGIKKFVGVSFSLERPQLRTDPRTGLLEHEAECLIRYLDRLGPIDLTDLGMWDLN